MQADTVKSINNTDAVLPTVEDDIYEIISGITPDEVKGVLEMISESGIFDFEELIAVEDISWQCAYGDHGTSCGFIQAHHVNQSGRKVVGFVCYMAIPNWPNKYELCGIAVLPQCENMGIGSALLKLAEDEIATLGGDKILLEIELEQDFEHVSAFYEKNGYEQETRFCRYYIPKDGNAVFSRAIANDREV
ncbi:MAG: GNAT family N-acetyltransferase [Desulfovibrio sp.]